MGHRDTRQRYEQEAMTPLHRHRVDGGYMTHQHPMLLTEMPYTPDPIDVANHSHMVILRERNYIWEDTGPMLPALPDKTA